MGAFELIPKEDDEGTERAHIRASDNLYGGGWVKPEQVDVAEKILGDGSEKILKKEDPFGRVDTTSGTSFPEEEMVQFPE